MLGRNFSFLTLLTHSDEPLYFFNPLRRKENYKRSNSVPEYINSAESSTVILEPGPAQP